MTIKFVVPGTPVSKLRHRTFITKSGSQRQYTPQETILYENMVSIVAREEMAKTNTPKFIGPIGVSCTFYLPIAETNKKRYKEGQWHTQRPDVDNLKKSCLDGMSGVVFDNDCCVALIFATKRWTHDNPRAEISVQGLGPTDPESLRQDAQRLESGKNSGDVWTERARAFAEAGSEHARSESMDGVADKDSQG